MNEPVSPNGVDIFLHWRHEGLILPRQMINNLGGINNYGVAGDPCIVWDEEINGWRMVLFYDPPGHAQAISYQRTPTSLKDWQFQGALTFTNPEALTRGLSKPYIVMDAHQPNRAAKVNGFYWLLGVCHGTKVVRRAFSRHLAGPWTLEPEPLIPNGSGGDFDAKHADAVTGVYFPERECFLYYYMGYPLEAQPNRPLSPYGSAQAVAVQNQGETKVLKLGEILPPSREKGHWASGWVGGLQLLPGLKHRWVGLINASPTPVDLSLGTVSREEPAPSLGGFAWCDEEWPVKNWHWCENPIEWIEDIPEKSKAEGEQVNLWRHHLLALEDGRHAIFYNSGSYGQEQLYLKLSTAPK